MRSLILTSLICATSLLVKAEVQTINSRETPTRLRPGFVVLSSDWAAKIPPTGRANSPDFQSTLFPGQKIAIGLMGEGVERDSLLRGTTARVHITTKPGGAEQIIDVTPATIRQIKADGADFALLALAAGGISGADRAQMEAATSLVSLAVLAPAWTVPDSGQATEVEIRVELAGTKTPESFEPRLLTIKRTEDWMRESSPPQEVVAKEITRYRGNLAPGQLLSWFQMVAKDGSLRAPPLHSYFALIFQADPVARDAAVKAYSALDPEIQGALLWVFRLGGLDLKKLFPKIPPESLARYESVEPLPDPRKLPHFVDPVVVKEVAGVGNIMDRCWGGWMATGDQSYLRALVGLLENAGDFPALQSWQKARGGEKGLNARVANGLSYQIAGWSIGSFQRTDPLVADWLIYWQRDPEISGAIRREIAGLATNPAFARK